MCEYPTEVHGFSLDVRDGVVVRSPKNGIDWPSLCAVSFSWGVMTPKLIRVKGSILYEAYHERSLMSVLEEDSPGWRDPLLWNTALTIAHLVQAGLEWRAVRSARIDIGSLKPVMIELYGARNMESLDIVALVALETLGIGVTSDAWIAAFEFAQGRLPRGW